MIFLAAVCGSRAVAAALSSALDIGFNNSLVDASTGANTTGAISGTVVYANMLPAVGTHSAMFTSTSTTKAYVQYTSVTANVSTTMTVMLWLKVTGVVDTGSPVYFDVGSPASGSYGVYMSRAANQAYDSSGTVDKNYSVCGSSSTFTLKDNTWHHLVFVVTNGSTTVGWYRNGVAQTALTGASTAAYPAITTSINTVRIGSSISAADKGLIGLIDRFQIYADDAGTAALAMYAAGNGYDGNIYDMYLYYNFDALYSSNTVFREEVSRSITTNALTINSTTLDTANANLGSGCIDNALVSWARNSTSYTFTPGGHSFAMWVYLPASVTTANRWIFGAATTNLSAFNIGLRLSGTTAPYQLTVFSDAINGSTSYQFVDLTAMSTMAATTWHHLVLVLTTAGGAGGVATYQLYLNGILQTLVTGDTSTTRSFSAPINTSNARAYRDILAAPGQGSIAGKMDDYRHYQRALTATDVKTLYNYRYGIVVNPNIASPVVSTNTASATQTSISGWTLATLAGSPTMVVINGNGGGWASYTYPSPATQFAAFQMPSNGSRMELSQQIYFEPGAYTFTFNAIGRSNSTTSNTGCQKRHRILFAFGGNSLTTELRISSAWIVTSNQFSIPINITTAGYTKVSVTHINNDTTYTSTANCTKFAVTPLTLPTTLAVANPNFDCPAVAGSHYAQFDQFASWALSGTGIWQINRGGWTPLPVTTPATTTTIGVQFTNAINSGFGVAGGSALLEQYVYIPTAGNYTMSFSTAPRNAAGYYTTAQQVTGSFNGTQVTSAMTTTVAWTTYTCATSSITTPGYYKVSLNMTCTADNPNLDTSAFIANVKINAV